MNRLPSNRHELPPLRNQRRRGTARRSRGNSRALEMWGVAGLRHDPEPRVGQCGLRIQAPIGAELLVDGADHDRRPGAASSPNRSAEPRLCCRCRAARRLRGQASRRAGEAMATELLSYRDRTAARSVAKSGSRSQYRTNARCRRAPGDRPSASSARRRAARSSASRRPRRGALQQQPLHAVRVLERETERDAGRPASSRGARTARTSIESRVRTISSAVRRERIRRRIRARRPCRRDPGRSTATTRHRGASAPAQRLPAVLAAREAVQQHDRGGRRWPLVG